MRDFSNLYSVVARIHESAARIGWMPREVSRSALCPFCTDLKFFSTAVRVFGFREKIDY
jgi:hypothetical protein